MMEFQAEKDRRGLAKKELHQEGSPDSTYHRRNHLGCPGAHETGSLLTSLGPLPLVGSTTESEILAGERASWFLLTQG